MWATPTTTPQNALTKEQLQKETWTPYTWSFANSKCGGGMWVPRSKFLSRSISCLGIGVCPRILLHKKMKKNERSCHCDNIESSSTRHHGKCSQCPAFKIKQNPSGRSPEDHQVRAHAYLPLHDAQSCFMLPLSILVCSSLNVWCSKYIHRCFKLSTVLSLECLLLSNWHGVKFDWWTSELILV